MKTTPESLRAINDCIDVTRQELRNLELQFEQEAIDAEKAGFLDQSAKIRSQVVAAYVAQTKVLIALNALFLDTVDRINKWRPDPEPEFTVEKVKEIQLPNVTPLVACEVVAAEDTTNV